MSAPATVLDSHPARVAELWQALLDAAHAGDERAARFLMMFGPWAQAELQAQRKS
jgi:hypothetical protein